MWSYLFSIVLYVFKFHIICILWRTCNRIALHIILKEPGFQLPCPFVKLSIACYNINLANGLLTSEVILPKACGCSKPSIKPCSISIYFSLHLAISVMVDDGKIFSSSITLSFSCKVFFFRRVNFDTKHF